MAQQILFIHAAGNKRYPDSSGKLIIYLQEKLGSGYNVIAPDMPNPDEPSYNAWREAIEHEIAALDDRPILIGHSIGGSTLVKTLVEGQYSKQVAGLFLIAAPYWGKDEDWQFDEYNLSEDFAANLPPISHIALYHSHNDEIVPYTHLDFWQEKFPQATAHTIKGNDHSFTKGLPELIRDIQHLKLF